MDDFALASWSVMVELLKHFEAKGILDRTDVLDVLDAAALPMETPTTPAVGPEAAVIIRRFAASL